MIEGVNGMSENAVKVFKTNDPYLTGAIEVISNHQITAFFEVVRGRTLAVFPVSDDLYRTMNAYNGGVAFPLIEFAEAVRRVKSEFITRKNQAGAGHNG